MALRSLLAAGALAATLVLASASAAAGTALAAGGETGIELVSGAGLANLNLRGAVLGTIARGTVTIRARPGREEVEIFVLGHEWARELADGATMYGGRGIRFRVFRGSWRVRAQGSGINVSAVGRGVVGLRGQGRYSLAGGPYERWPASYRAIILT